MGIVLLIVSLIGAIMLTGAQMKLYGLYREAKWQSEEMRTQTRLLAAIANRENPATTPDRQEGEPSFR